MMKNLNKKSLLVLAALALLLTVGVGSTLAFLVDSTPSIENRFTPGTVDTQIEEVIEGDAKKSIVIKNTGDVAVYVRVALVGNWVDASGNVVAPWAGISAFNAETWLEKDGFYYYKQPVPKGTSTTNLLTASITDDSKPADIPEDAHLEVTVIHQSIQAEPTDAVQDAWGLVPGSN